MERHQNRFFRTWKGICMCMAIVLLLFSQVGGVKAASGKSDAKKKVTVKLYKESGRKIYKKITVKKGEKIYLPGMRNGKNKTMLGWSVERGSGKTPKYQVGQKITVRRSMKLYPVMFLRSEEPDLNGKELAEANAAAAGPQGRFKRVVFVGDSRMTGLRSALKEEFGSSVTSNVAFVCKYGSGLEWLKRRGERKILQLAGKDTAIIFNHGVNDLKKTNDYISYMRKLGKKLRKKGCTLFYLSVNPFNKLEIAAFGNRKEKEDERSIINFNKRIKRTLCKRGPYHYLDSYSYLIQNGYGTQKVKRRDDGIHYTSKTYKRIYEFCMNRLSRY